MPGFIGINSGPSPGQANGLWPEFFPVTVRMRGGAGTKNRIVSFLLEISQEAAVVDNDRGQSDSGLCNVYTPDDLNPEEAGFLGVLLKDVADDGLVDVCMWGIVDIYINKVGATDATAGLSAVYDFSAGASGLTAIDSALAIGNYKIFAKFLETVLNASLPTTVSCWFNGLTGWGHHYEVA